jgi:hypothetical protein
MRKRNRPGRSIVDAVSVSFESESNRILTMRKPLFFICVFTFFSIVALAQKGKQFNVHEVKLNLDDDDDWYDEEKGFSFGINIGAYLGSKKPAMVYNGTCAYPLTDNIAQCYRIPERLGKGDGSVFNQLVQNEILNSQNATGGDYFFPADTYPMNMRYNPAIMLGLHVKYNFNLFKAITFNINYARLKTVDKFSMIFTGTSLQPNQQQDIRLFDIIGEEDRLSIALGYRNGWEINNGANFYLEFGGALNGTKWRENYLQIDQLRYDLYMNFIPGQPNPQGVNAPQTTFGSGYYFGTGTEFKISGKYGFDLGFNLVNDKITIGTYSERVWNKMIFATFSL